MNLIFLFGIGSAINFAKTACSKLCSNMIPQNSCVKFSFYLLLQSIISCLFFAIQNRFAFSFNMATLWYSIIFALCAALGILSSLIAYRYASVSGVDILSMAGGMICTVAVGWIIFSEELSTKTLLRLGIMLLAVFFIFMDKRKETKSSVERNGNGLLALILVTSVITFISCANTVIVKFFTLSNTVTNEASFFFLTNLLLLIGSGIVFGISTFRNEHEFREALPMLSPKKLLFITGNTIGTNIQSLIQVYIVTQMNLSIYSTISPALGIIVGLLLSLMFREKLGIFAYLAAAISLITVII